MDLVKEFHHQPILAKRTSARMPMQTGITIVLQPAIRLLQTMGEEIESRVCDVSALRRPVAVSDAILKETCHTKARKS